MARGGDHAPVRPVGVRGVSCVIVLDVDDTLYLERDYVRSGFNALTPLVLERTDLAGFGDLAWQRFLEGERGRIFDGVLEGRDLAPGLIEELIESYRAHEPSIELAHGATDLFQWAKRHNVSLAVLTDGAPASQRAKIRALGILEWVDVVVITDELNGPRSRKPDPAGFRAVMSQFYDLAPDRFIYLADNPGKDLEGSRRAGWGFIRVRRPGGLHYETLSPEPAPPEVSSLTEAIDLLEQLLIDSTL